MSIEQFASIYGVDFSGARLAGRTVWVARTVPAGRGGRLRLVELDRLDRLAGTAERAPALAHLVERIAQSRGALWAMDFPFSMPVELLERRQSWPGLLRFFRDWPHDGYDIGVHFLNKAKALGGRNHLMRHTDTAAKAPFSCYHYRITYQTFHGIRDVLLPLTRHAGAARTAILPFQARRWNEGRVNGGAFERVVVEACPSSTLKRLGLPHQNYKQPEGGPLTAKRRRTRRHILEGLLPFVQFTQTHRRVMMRDGGGDAFDALIAAVGVSIIWSTANLRAIHASGRFRREGYIYG